VDGVPAADFAVMADYVRAHPGKDVVVVYERDGQQLSGPVTLGERLDANTGTNVGYLGVAPQSDIVKSNPLEAVPESAALVWDITTRSVTGLVQIFSPSGIGSYVDHLASANDARDPDAALTEEDAEGRVISIVGAVRLSSQAAETGPQYLIGFLIAMNIFVGIFNMVPLLPLDGGHVIIATYERLRSRKGRPYHADVRKMLPVAYATVAVLGVMFLTSLYLDIANPLANPFQ
jgi:membrane-associated protease RseP (regulator of RpoE activity)